MPVIADLVPGILRCSIFELQCRHVFRLLTDTAVPALLRLRCKITGAYYRNILSAPLKKKSQKQEHQRAFLLTVCDCLQ